MRALFWLLAVFAAAVALALAGRVGDGYVLFVYPPWRVEISLLLFVLALAAAFVVAYFAVRLVGHTLALPAQVRAFRERRKREHAQRALAAALHATSRAATRAPRRRPRSPGRRAPRPGWRR